LFALVDNCRVRVHKEFEMCSAHVAGQWTQAKQRKGQEQGQCEKRGVEWRQPGRVGAVSLVYDMTSGFWPTAAECRDWCKLL